MTVVFADTNENESTYACRVLMFQGMHETKTKQYIRLHLLRNIKVNNICDVLWEFDRTDRGVALMEIKYGE